MANNYNEQLANAPSKNESRVIIANDAKKEMGRHRVLFHYLGGETFKTPFEDLFSKILNRVVFARYEKKAMDYSPDGYINIHETFIKMFAEWREAGKSFVRNGVFFNGDFFSYVNMAREFLNGKHRLNFYWLDFCGLPVRHLVEGVQKNVFDVMKKGEVCYVTFGLNPRVPAFETYVRNIFRNVLHKKGVTIAQRGQILLDYFRSIMPENMSCNLIQTYDNEGSKSRGGAPMAVLKFKRL